MESFVAGLIHEGVSITPGQPADVKALMNHPDPQPEHFKALRAKLTPAAKPAAAPKAPAARKPVRKARSVRK